MKDQLAPAALLALEAAAGTFIVLFAPTVAVVAYGIATVTIVGLSAVMALEDEDLIYANWGEKFWLCFHSLQFILGFFSVPIVAGIAQETGA